MSPYFEMILKCRNLTIDVPNKNKTGSAKFLQVINDISVEFRYNELTAIMGPSGCGKSAFIAALTGKIQKGSITSGSITIDGKNREYRQFVKNSGMFKNDEDTFTQLTLYETLSYTLDFYGIKPNIRKKLYIYEFLKDYGLKHIMHSKILQLNVGQRRKAFLAIKLIVNQKIIFADDPTSGLDPSTAYSISKLLKDEANKGRMVILCIHQPTVKRYNLFDKLMLMTEGQVVYHGPAASFREYLMQKHIFIGKYFGSFPSIIVDMVTEESLYSSIQQLIRENHKPRTSYIEPIKQNDSLYDYRINLRHIWVIQIRSWKLKLQNKKKIVKPIIFSLILGLFIILINRTIYLRAIHDNNHALAKYLHIKKASGVNLLIKKQSIYLLEQKMTKLYLSIYIGCIIASSTGAFVSNTNIIRNEIADGYYSSTSYVFALYVYYVTKNIMLMVPFTVYFIIGHPSKITLSVIPVHFLAPIFITPVAFSIGSLSNNKKIIYVYTSIFVLPLIFPQSMIYNLTLYAILLPTRLLRIIMFLLIGLMSFSPTYYFITFYTILQEKTFLQFDKILMYSTTSVQTYLDIVKEIVISIDNNSLVFPHVHMPILSMILIFIGMTILMILFVLYRQCKYLIPEIRMILSK